METVKESVFVSFSRWIYRTRLINSGLILVGASNDSDESD